MPQHFGTWTCTTDPPLIHLLSLWFWGGQGLLDPGLDLPDTCMSDSSAQAIAELTSAVQALTLAISGQATSATASSADSTPGDWEVIGSESQDVRIALDSKCVEVKQRAAEEGPGEIPPILLDIARSKLTAKPPGADFRAKRAFTAGFWARVAVNTSTPYRQADPVPGCKIQHWVVLSCPAFEGAARFTTRTDFGRAIEGDLHNSVYETFASQTELEIFCAGASAPLPALRTWRKPMSSSSRMGMPASSSGYHRQMQ